jgi:hypothetical protein
MQEYKILILEADELRKMILEEDTEISSAYRRANHVIVRRADGTCYTTRDRYKYSKNKCKTEIFIRPDGEGW